MHILCIPMHVILYTHHNYHVIALNSISTLYRINIYILLIHTILYNVLVENIGCGKFQENARTRTTKTRKRERKTNSNR